jgi:hypothetical protein
MGTATPRQPTRLRTRNRTDHKQRHFRVNVGSWPKTAAAPSLADEFERPIKINGTSQRGMLWEEADKSSGTRARGWEAIRGRMMATLPPRENPGLYITRSCPNLPRTLQALPRDPHKPNAADHLPDVTRYLLGKRHGPTFRTYRHP